MTKHLKNTLHVLLRDLLAPDWATRAEAIAIAARLLSSCADKEVSHRLRGVVALGAEDHHAEVRLLAAQLAYTRGGIVRPAAPLSCEHSGGRHRY